MPRFESLLAITDFSTGARHAVERTALLATEHGLRAGVLHVVEKSLVDRLKRLFGDAADAAQAFENNAERTLQNLIEAIEEERGIRLEPMVSSGRPLERVLEAGAKFELLVVGARGRHKMRRLALGTTSRALLRSHRKPVLLVRRPVEHGYRRVLVAMDFSDYAMRALDWARTLAPTAQLHLLHVFDNPTPRSSAYVRTSAEGLEKFRRRLLRRAHARMEALETELGELPQEVTFRVERGDPATALLEQAEEHAADLLVMGKHARPPAEELLLGSVTLRVLDRARADVLVVQ